MTRLSSHRRAVAGALCREAIVGLGDQRDDDVAKRRG
jgi:hypothetical protein